MKMYLYKNEIHTYSARSNEWLQFLNKCCHASLFQIGTIYLQSVYLPIDWLHTRDVFYKHRPLNCYYLQSEYNKTTYLNSSANNVRYGNSFCVKLQINHITTYHESLLKAVNYNIPNCLLEAKRLACFDLLLYHHTGCSEFSR